MLPVLESMLSPVGKLGAIEKTKGPPLVIVAVIAGNVVFTFTLTELEDSQKSIGSPRISMETSELNFPPLVFEPVIVYLVLVWIVFAMPEIIPVSSSKIIPAGRIGDILNLFGDPLIPTRVKVGIRVETMGEIIEAL